jgi:hypothetical protein
MGYGPEHTHGTPIIFPQILSRPRVFWVTTQVDMV